MPTLACRKAGGIRAKEATAAGTELPLYEEWVFVLVWAVGKHPMSVWLFSVSPLKRTGLLLATRDSVMREDAAEVGRV